MAELSQHHRPDLKHHVSQARVWLEQSDQGKHTVALSYAALELRYAIERLAVHYWRALLNRSLSSSEIERVGQFKFVERQIYNLAGHQQEINKHFEFAFLYLKELQIDVPLKAPQISALSKYWHDCSEVCHIGWVLASSMKELQSATYAGLVDMAELLAEQAASLGWLVINDASLVQLRDRFVQGKATAVDLREHMERGGAWARVEFPDGRPPRFIGAPVPVNDQDSA